MKLLLYSWQANNEQILADNLINLGFEMVWFKKVCKHYTRDMELAAEMIPFIHKEGIEGVISFNYFPIISMICDTCKIPYYAWVYDCPHFTLYAKHVMLSCNHIGIFDKEMVRKLQGKGVKTVYHVPLSVDTEYFAKAIDTKADKEKYHCDISFVGSFYTDEHNYYDRLFRNKMTGIDKAIQKQSFSYEKDYLREAVASGEVDLCLIQKKMEEQGLMLGDDYFANPEELLFATVLEKKVTVEERRILLTEVAEKFGEKYRFCLYTGSDLKNLPQLQQYHKGVVDYHTQMPLIFAGSRINLNLSLRSIHSGIPLRVLDIMACGGFVLSNWQPEIAEYFVENKEIVTFQSLEECKEKMDYYLKYEQKRQKIAEAGQKMVREKFNYTSGLLKLFEIEGD
ncbi:MAG: DUF3880 domain-containing protein [Lachnospiraceae bacterium]|nr:DUF3880 domain-containing protein [Lachnospiraceae bacterium]